MLSKAENLDQNISMNYSLASSANQHNGIIHIGQANNFHNANTVYTIGFPKNNLSIASSFNYNYSDIARDNSQAYGTALDISKKFFDKKMNSSFGLTYNTTTNKEDKNKVFNFRINTSITLAEKHNFSLNALQLFKNSSKENSLSELTITLGYAYSFKLNNTKK